MVSLKRLEKQIRREPSRNENPPAAVGSQSGESNSEDEDGSSDQGSDDFDDEALVPMSGEGWSFD